MGSTGVLNVGSMTLATPTPDFMTRLLAGNQMVSAPHLAQVLDNDMPLSKSGVIDIRGRINSLSHAAVSAGDVNISGIIETGTQAKISVETLVNMNGNRAMVDLGEVSATPSITIQAEGDVNLSGRVAADGADNIDAGQISITAKDNIIAGLGADVSASGRGDNSSGGEIYVMARRGKPFSRWRHHW